MTGQSRKEEGRDLPRSEMGPGTEWLACFVFSEFSEKRLSNRLAEATILCSVKCQERQWAETDKVDGYFHHLLRLVQRVSSKEGWSSARIVMCARLQPLRGLEGALDRFAKRKGRALAVLRCVCRWPGTRKWGRLWSEHRWGEEERHWIGFGHLGNRTFCCAVCDGGLFSDSPRHLQ